MSNASQHRRTTRWVNGERLLACECGLPWPCETQTGGGTDLPSGVSSASHPECSQRSGEASTAAPGSAPNAPQPAPPDAVDTAWVLRESARFWDSQVTSWDLEASTRSGDAAVRYRSHATHARSAAAFLRALADDVERYQREWRKHTMVSLVAAEAALLARLREGATP